MTLPDALAWAEARTTDRWRQVAAQNPSNHGDLYAQMDAEAMDTLAEAVREREARWEGLRAKFASTSEGGRFYWEGYAEEALEMMRALERGTEVKHD